MVRTLAEQHRRTGDADATVRYLHRLLAKDPHDEQAHLDLIDTLSTAGRHGEARPARSRYTAAMGAVA